MLTIITHDTMTNARIHDIVDMYGPTARTMLETAGTTIHQLRPEQGYRDASPELRRLTVNIDEWPAPPAGLFVVAERTLYLRVPEPMVIAHELGHAIDCALGGGIYLSGMQPNIRKAFATARGYVTPYAASGLDEYFAECARAFIGVNSAKSPWPAVSRARLQELDPAMDAILARLLAPAETIAC